MTSNRTFENMKTIKITPAVNKLLNSNREHFKKLIKELGRLCLVFLIIGSYPAQSQVVSQTYTSSGTFTVPPGVTSITVECWGAGGAGGGGTDNTLDPAGAGGGAGGAYAKKTLSVIPNANYTVTVAGITPGGTGTGATGGPSWFGTVATVYAEGGAGGSAITNGDGPAGLGSSANSIGDIVYSGGSGANGTDATGGGGGGGGAGSSGSGGNANNSNRGTGTTLFGGNGGNGAPTSEGNGNNGSDFGGGGGGAFCDDNTDHLGGNGASGQVVVSWVPAYRAQFTAMDFGSSVWLSGETRTATVTVTNTGQAAWTDAAPDVNIGVKWNADPDYQVRVNAGNLAPGASRTYSLTITAPTVTGANNLTFDVVNEGSCWFGNNNGSCGPGNTVYTSVPLTILPQPASGFPYAISGTYTVPPGITSLKVEAWGGGGGGSSITNGTTTRGGGGGGGAYSKGIVTVIPGNTYNVVVGIGGQAGLSGGASSFGSSLVVAAGGGGATNNSTTRGVGGTIAASTGTTRYQGGNGANGGGTFSGGGGGGAGSDAAGGNASGATGGTGSSLYGGTGGTGLSGSADGQDGSFFGGGGSGAVTNSATGRNGGAGFGGLVIINLPSQVTLSSPSQVTASGVYQGTTKVILSAFQTEVSVSEANLTQIMFNSFGTYTDTDVSKFQLWYNSTNNFAGASQLGTDITTGLGVGSHVFNFFRSINAGATGYFWITADVANTATPNATVSIDPLAPSNLIFELATLNGSVSSGGSKTFIPVPRVDLASSNPAMAAASVNQGTKNHPIYRFTTAITWAGATLNSLTFTTAGSYAAIDVLNFKLWYNTTDDLSTASQVGSPIIGSLGTGSHTFSGLNLTTVNGSTGYFWITIDVAPFPTDGRTIRVNAITTGDLAYSSIVFSSGTTSNGSNQTIVRQNGVFITTTYPAVSANSVLQGSINQNMYKFLTIVSGTAVTLNSVSFSTTGSYVATDIVNFKLYHNTVNSFVGATQIGSITTGLGTGNHTFSGLNQNTAANTISYFWVTADIASAAVPGGTINVAPIGATDLVYSGILTKNATTFAGGIQTIQLKIDTDGDGVADLYDLDDDNDGVPDFDENVACNTAVAELFPNGNFDAGNTGFYSGYQYVTIVNQSSLHPEGIYAITPNANSGHGSFANCSAGHGNMMVVNGSSNPNLIVWSSGTIPVTPNTDYTLTINLTSVNPGNPAQLIFNVNGENIGLQFNATTTNCQWIPGIAIWNSGNNTSATFDIMNLNLIAGGNDFAIDDISCKYKVNCDFDGDGVPDKLDLDSDNDGIYDVVEAGGTATATGTISGFVDADQDGLSDNVDNKDAGTGGSVNIFNGTPLPNPDTDSDLMPNSVDADSDNDFCPDTKEAGLPDPDEDGRLGPSPVTVDSKGKVTSASGYTGTIDANGDGTRDYVQQIPYIATQPTDKTLCIPTPGTTFSIAATNTGGTYVWQVSTDNGTSWTDLTNSSVYSGTSGAGAGALLISNAVTTDYNNYLYRILLTNTAYNCSPLASNTVRLNVYPGAPATPGLITGNTTVCSSVSQNYSIALVPSATSYTWTVPAGWSIASGQGTNSVNVLTGASGGNVQVVASNFCGNSGTRTLAVNISAPSPTITAPVNGSTVCQSADVVYTTQSGKSNYLWTIGGAVGVDYIIISGGSTSDNSLTLNWLKTGSKTVSVNYSSGGCSGLSPATVVVTVNPNAVVLTQPVTPAPVCAGTGTIPLSITASGASSYQWQVSTDGGSSWSNLSNSGFYNNVDAASMTISNPPASFNNYRYRCEITGSCGAATSFSVTLTVNLNTVSAASLFPEVCLNTVLPSVTHNTTGSTGIGTPSSLPSGVSATWSGSSITIDGTPTTSGTFNYSIPLTGGCGTVNATGTIIVNPLPTVSISLNETSGTNANDGSICIGDAVSLTSSGGSTYAWSSGQLVQSINVSPVANTTYTVTVTDGNGCTDTESQLITVLPVPNTGKFYRKPNN